MLRHAFCGLVLSSLLVTPAVAQGIHVLAHATEPFMYQSADGQPAGLELDILQYFARTSGYVLEVEWMTDFDELLARIARGEADLAAATITITEARDEVLDFSVPYFPVRVMLVTRADDTVEAIGELSGATLATIEGTTYQESLQGVPAAQFVYASTEVELFDLVSAGEARAAAVDSGIALSLLGRYPNLQLGLALSEEQQWGFAFPPGSELRPKVDAVLETLRGSAVYYRLLERHLGARAAAVVRSGRQD